jgi:hypothetical protein
MKREIAFWLNARDKPGLLVALMKALAGDARIGFCGGISPCDFSDIPESPESALFEGSQGDAIVLKLETGTIQPILAQVLPDARCVHSIVHIVIEKSGRPEVVIGDNFHNECISVGPGVPQTLLDDLVSNGVLRGYTPHSEIKKRYPHAWEDET